MLLNLSNVCCINEKDTFSSILANRFVQPVSVVTYEDPSQRMSMSGIHSLSTRGAQMRNHTLPQRTGRETVERADRQDFQALYQKNFVIIYRYVYRSVKNREEAEDLTSQIFLKAFCSIDQERDLRIRQYWLFQVARTTLADYWRIRSRVSTCSLEELLDTGWEGATEASTTMSSRSIDRLRRLLQALPEHYREVLNCRFLLNLSIKETALRLGLSEANVKVLQFRALKRAAALEDNIPG